MDRRAWQAVQSMGSQRVGHDRATNTQRQFTDEKTETGRGKDQKLAPGQLAQVPSPCLFYSAASIILHLPAVSNSKLLEPELLERKSQCK